MKLGQMLDDKTASELASVARQVPKGEMMSDANYALLLELEGRWLGKGTPQPESDSEGR